MALCASTARGSLSQPQPQILCNHPDTVGFVRNKVQAAPRPPPQPVQRSRGVPLRGRVKAMALRASAGANRHRGVSISFDPIELDWVDSLVHALDENGYPLAARSEVIRMALLELRDALRGKTQSEIVEYFAHRHGDRLVASVVAGMKSTPKANTDTGT